MNDGSNTPQNRGRQRIFVGGAIALAIMMVVVIAIVRLLGSGDVTETVDELPTEESRTILTGESQTSLLYFADPQNGLLKEEPRTLVLENAILPRLEGILQALLTGPTGALVSPIPRGVELRHAFVDRRQIAYVDLSSTLLDEHPGGTTAEKLTVEAILLTVLSNFPEQIQRVQILVEGAEIGTLAGHVDISRPLTIATVNTEVAAAP